MNLATLQLRNVSAIDATLLNGFAPQHHALRAWDEKGRNDQGTTKERPRNDQGTNLERRG
ncbi:hypothetical protein E4K67_03940 [Desulfosporosinus fructosivorans]|uniref:Uncharacterized protein n=1 Tax=Desulfosporosinus fructosivorans TaxID=2018669 RepID=A0A4Z0RCG1_9FIRM|nr:hypothetical protein [Desulfosporosinus fructosivorans]TGE40134.1 hypothetical protein E4K67_03940 [Desulfosporosinus fructosivorans]